MLFDPLFIHLVCLFSESSHATYPAFADLEFSGVKSLSRFRFLLSHFILYIRCYTVCTHNRIRSPRLAAFGRIETRWVREVGKFGPYLRYKDWLRRRLLALNVVIVVTSFSSTFYYSIFLFRILDINVSQYFLWELARTRGIRLFN